MDGGATGESGTIPTSSNVVRLHYSALIINLGILV